MTRPLRALALAAFLAPATAVAGPTEWMPAEADCTETGEQLEATAAETLAACTTQAREDGFVGTKAVRLATDRCMQARGWEQVEKATAERYAPFCEVARRLQDSTFDDPIVIASIPSPNPA